MPMPPVREEGEPLLRADALAKTFHQSGHDVHALADVSAEIWPGETLGLVGESGSGKTTLARVLLGITPRDEGGVLELDGQALPPTTGKRSTEQVRAIQIVFQNPDSALNRRHSVRMIVGRALTKLAGLSGQRARGEAARPDPVGEAGRPLPLGAAVGAVGRPQAARRHRPCLRRQPQAGGLRRADVGARRVGAGGDPQPAGRAAARRADGVPVHLARPRRRPLPVRPDRRALPGTADGAGPGRAGLLGPPPPVHRGAALRRADDRGRRAAADQARRARSPAPRTRRRAASSRPAARASWARSARRPSRRWPRPSRGT